MRKAVRVVSESLLKRISDPASRRQSDYLSYRNGNLHGGDLIERLPHVAMLGDSACMGIYVSSPWSTFWRGRTCCGNNWFLDTRPAPPGIQSISKRLEELTPFVAIECAGIGAVVDRDGERTKFFRRILRTRNFSEQISDVTAMKRFPDLILIAIGHNNVDWAWRCSATDLKQPENRLQRQSQQFRENFTRQMRRLIEHAQAQCQAIAIVVFGLINFESYFKGREIAERIQGQDPSRYQHIKTTYKYLVSFRPEYRCNLVRLATMMNDHLCAMVCELNPTVASKGNVQLRYSDALATADLSRAELLHSVDGWHASVEGHNVLAAAAFGDLGPSLEFLGIGK